MLLRFPGVLAGKLARVGIVEAAARPQGGGGRAVVAVATAAVAVAVAMVGRAIHGLHRAAAVVLARIARIVVGERRHGGAKGTDHGSGKDTSRELDRLHMFFLL
jgi:hypothetical protein